MRILTWNIRGMNSDTKTTTVRNLVRQQRVKMLFLQETKMESIPESTIRKIWYDDEFCFIISPSTGRSGGLLSIWDKSDFQLDKSIVNSRFIYLNGKWSNKEWKIALINIYSPNVPSDQAQLWKELIDLKNADEALWLIGGDFNVISSRDERAGCSGTSFGCANFIDFISQGHFIDLPMVGKNFTLFGPNNKRSRLDGFLFDESLLSNIGDVTQTGLKRMVSGHVPVLVSSEVTDWGPIPFKFYNVWLKMEGCKELILNVLRGENKTKLTLKLRKVKAALKQWTKEGKGDLYSTARKLEENIEALEEEGNKGDLNVDKAKQLQKLKLALWETLKLQEALWKQKARMNWMVQGDSNTAFFRKVSNVRSKKKIIHGLKLNDKWCGDPLSLRKGIFEHFKKQFSGVKRQWQAVFNLKFKQLDVLAAKSLVVPFSVEEINDALWLCDEAKAVELMF
ncbi:hypothetical protein HRI_003498400 [Hibiscus trionum]|uniref:Endonuclease/exonuclease/phosphatase domain-containing protein n=1 Tax=Hibiscus trionum TaxID=183268 RepID=A0A9W7INI0_HIBTR|nr:hypothetical protein HRI_003498400 [Hibiscus trionum]